MQKSKDAQKFGAVQIDKVRRITLVDDIVERLIDYIVEQELEPGDKLPSERLLGEGLGVSRFPLREALAQLQALGIVSVSQGKGTFVSKFSVPRLLRRLSPILRTQSGVTTLNMVETRLALECPVASLAARRRSEDTVERLKNDLLGMEREIHNKESFIEYDMNFHEAIAEATANPVLMALVAMLHNLMYTVQERFPDTLEARRKSLEYHKEIFSAIEDKDAQKASETMRNHLEDIAQRLSEEEGDGDAF